MCLMAHIFRAMIRNFIYISLSIGVTTHKVRVPEKKINLKSKHCTISEKITNLLFI